MNVTKLVTEKSRSLSLKNTAAISNKEVLIANNDTKDLPESSVSMFHTQTVANLYLYIVKLVKFTSFSATGLFYFGE